MLSKEPLPDESSHQNSGVLKISEKHNVISFPAFYICDITIVIFLPPFK